MNINNLKPTNKQKVIDTRIALKREWLVLIKHSEEAKNETYGNLYQAISEYDVLSNDEVNFGGKFDNTAKFVLTNNQAKKVFIENVKREWVATIREDIANVDEQVNCQLCGRDNLYIYYILNKNNDKELHVGSSCIDKFPGLAGIKEARKKVADLDKIRKQLKRMEAFNSEFPNTADFQKSNRKEYNEFPILLPNDIGAPLLATIENLENTYDDFIKSGSIDNVKDTFITYRSLLEKYSDQFELAKQIIAKNEGLPNVCRRREIMWMQSNNKHVLIEKISRNKGVYNIDTVSEVYNYDFVLDLKPLIEKCCTGTMFQFSEFRIESNSIEFTTLDRDLKIEVSLRSFMQNVGGKCIFIENYKIEFSTDVFVMPATYDNIQTVTNRINKAINRNKDNMKFSFDDASGRFIHLEKWINKTYTKIGASVFLQLYFSKIEKDDQDLIADYLSYCDDYNRSGTKWEPIKERMSDDELNQMMKSPR